LKGRSRVERLVNKMERSYRPQIELSVGIRGGVSSGLRMWGIEGDE
jgi:hypothetical protein